MKSLFLLPYGVLITAVIFCTFSLFLQTMTIAMSTACIQIDKKYFVKNLLEIFVLCQLFLMLMVFANILYSAECIIIFYKCYTACFVLIFLLITVTCVYLFSVEKDVSCPLTIAFSLLGIPALEMFFGSISAVLFTAAQISLTVRAFIKLRAYLKSYREGLTNVSAKEALDNLDYGVLFYRTDKNSKGQILLLNNRMRRLMLSLTGRVFYNACDFLKVLSSGNVLPACKVYEHDKLPAFILPDNSAWLFDSYEIKGDRHQYSLLTSSDITELKEVNDRLKEKNKELQLKNFQLKELLEDLEDKCKREETLRVKNKVHDILGQRISLVLRSIRENKEPDEKLLRMFCDGLPEDLKNISEDYIFSLNRLIESFKSLGIEVNIKGEFPKDSVKQKLFYEIIAEEMSNSVRHGYASVIDISITCENGMWTIVTEDNGTSKKDKINFGGGFTSIKKKAESVGGSMYYSLKPRFSVTVKMPREETK